MEGNERLPIIIRSMITNARRHRDVPIRSDEEARQKNNMCVSRDCLMVGLAAIRPCVRKSDGWIPYYSHRRSSKIGHEEDGMVDMYVCGMSYFFFLKKQVDDCHALI